MHFFCDTQLHICCAGLCGCEHCKTNIVYNICCFHVIYCYEFAKVVVLTYESQESGSVFEMV